jgi:hypothetical protein
MAKVIGVKLKDADAEKFAEAAERYGFETVAGWLRALGLAAAEEKLEERGISK